MILLGFLLQEIIADFVAGCFFLQSIVDLSFLLAFLLAVFLGA